MDCVTVVTARVSVEDTVVVMGLELDIHTVALGALHLSLVAGRRWGVWWDKQRVG